MRKFRIVVPGLVVLAMLVVGLVPASAGQPGSGTSYVYVQNADPAGNAQVAVTFYNDDGTAAGTANVASLPPYVGQTVSTNQAFLGSTWRGSVVVSSDRQVSAVGRTIYTGVPDAPDGLYAGDYTAVGTTSTSSFLPYVFDSTRNTIFTVQNAASSAATIYLNYFNRTDGQHIAGSTACSGSPIVDTIPANGVVHYDLLNQTRNGVYAGGAGGDIPCMSGGTAQPTAGTAGDFEGAIYITSTTEIVAAASTHWATFEGVYTGAVSDDEFLFFPQIARAKNASTGDWVRWSAVIVQNTQNVPVSIMVSLIGSGGTVTFTDTIPALSSAGYNTRFQGDFPNNMWTNCTSAHGFQPTCELESQLGTSDWTGAATVEVLTPGGKIVGVNHVQYFAGRVFTYEGLQAASGTNIAVCPILQDQDSTSNRRWSALLIQNTSLSASANVKAYFFKQGNTAGGLAGADLTLDNAGVGYSVAAGGRFGLNTRFDVIGGPAASVFDPMGNNWAGSAVIVSGDEPIVATASVFRADTGTGEDWATAYNCYNVVAP